MFKFRAFSTILPILFISVLISYKANAQTFLPVGPQTNVPINTVIGGGWTECYRDTYNIEMDADTVLSQCPGELLMLSCLPTGSDTLTLLAQGQRSDVTFDTGNDNNDVLHVANGVGWYFNNTGSSEAGSSWGFVRAGDSVRKNNCDLDSSGANDERLCWHLHGNGGYRCGETRGINSSVDFERIVYMPSLPPAIPTLSEWGMISAFVGLGLIGVLFAVRRKRAALNS